MLPELLITNNSKFWNHLCICFLILSWSKNYFFFFFRTRLARNDVLTGALDNSWERTPEAIKEAYGFPYYEDFKGRMQKLAGNARPYVKEVVDCMVQAVTVVNPKLSYRCSGPTDKLRYWLMSILPTQLVDIIICKIIQPSHRQLSRGNRNGKSS